MGLYVIYDRVATCAQQPGHAPFNYPKATETTIATRPEDYITYQTLTEQETMTGCVENGPYRYIQTTNFKVGGNLQDFENTYERTVIIGIENAWLFENDRGITWGSWVRLDEEEGDFSQTLETYRHGLNLGTGEEYTHRRTRTYELGTPITFDQFTTTLPTLVPDSHFSALPAGRKFENSQTQFTPQIVTYATFQTYISSFLMGGNSYHYSYWWYDSNWISDWDHISGSPWFEQPFGSWPKTGYASSPPYLTYSKLRFRYIWHPATPAADRKSLPEIPLVFRPQNQTVAGDKPDPVDESQKFTPITSWTSAWPTATTEDVSRDFTLDIAKLTETKGKRGAIYKTPFALWVDANRDGTLTNDLNDLTTKEQPYRFWSNDDDDSGPAAGDNMPGQPANLADYNNTTVDSIRDLVDFFPVYLDIKQLITVLPPSGSIKYKLKQADGALNFFYTNLTNEYDASEKRSKAYDYQYKILTSGFGPNFTQAAGAATTQQITAAGVELNTTFLDGIKNNEWGVVLIEGRVTSDRPLVLAVEKDGTQIAEVSVNIKISPVEKMFRHVNLAGSVKEYDGSNITPPFAGLPTNTAEPVSYPDSLTNGKYFVFLHGFNVDADSARGWNAEIFKRMHMLGSKARFVGVQWNGSPPLPALIAALAPRKYLDYHKAVFQALQTGDLLAGSLSFTNGADVTVAAHSLGNIVTSHAIQNGGFTPTRYYMINAASPIEAYSLADAAGQFDIMRHEDWVDYEPRLYASKWHELFAASDNRSALTWKNRFVSVRNRTILHNFHSGQEDVVANGDQITSASILKLANEGNLDEVATGEFSWKLQELVKGNYLTSSASGLVIERRQGGWEFNVAWDNLVVLGNQADLPPEQTVNKVIINGIVYDSQPLQPNEASSITSEELKTKPFFRDFNEADLINPNATIASAKAGETKVKYDTLARAIPAMSHAVAANRLESLDSKNYDMPTLAKKNGWHDAGNRWRHSDFYAVALPYVYPMFQEMISRGELNK